MSNSARDRVLVACIGNIFLGDDGFGCAVARQLETMKTRPEIEVVDYGIRGLDLAYALLEPRRAVVFVDAIMREGSPGTIYVLQCVDTMSEPSQPATIDPHSMDPSNLLSMARSLGDVNGEIYIIGCEPTDFGDELIGRMGLSEVVRSAVPEAARTVLELIDRILPLQARSPAKIFAT